MHRTARATPERTPSRLLQSRRCRDGGGGSGSARSIRTATTAPSEHSLEWLLRAPAPQRAGKEAGARAHAPASPADRARPARAARCAIVCSSSSSSIFRRGCRPQLAPPAALEGAPRARGAIRATAHSRPHSRR
eukprot:scaffold823_cov397-Prasinococcus_capsulatus_cf.AAC.5